MPSSYFNLILEEIRSAESSGVWEPVSHLFLYQHLYSPPHEEREIIRARLRAHADMTDPFASVLGSGYTPYDGVEIYILKGASKDLRCFLLSHFGRGFQFWKDSEYFPCHKLIFVDDVVEALKTLGQIQPRLPKIPLAGMPANYTEHNTREHERREQAVIAEFYALSMIYVMRQWRGQEAFPPPDFKMKPNRSYKDYGKIYRIYCDYLTLRDQGADADRFAKEKLVTFIKEP